MIIKKSFYEKKTLKVARDLLGCFLVCRLGKKIIRAKIVETEAYFGKNDLASHASRGRTLRTEKMFGLAGHAYIYLIYGMYYCLNIVTERKDYPAAVLIRSVEIKNTELKKINGPGKICRELKIDKKLNGWDLTQRKKIWLETGEKIRPNKIKRGKRIGVDYAGKYKNKKWRFYFE